MKLLIKLLVLFTILGINISFAAINLTVSPIKYELEGDPGTTITKTATLHNRGNTDIIIKTGKSDFIASGTDGGPNFVRYSELVHPDQQLSSWISLNSSGFTIPANSKKEITFDVVIPNNATPGGHYGAVFFKNNNSESSSSSGSAVGINVDYGIIILLKVNGEIITDVDIDDISISGGNSNMNNNNYSTNNTNDGLYSSIPNSISEKKYNLVGDKPNILLKKDKCLFDFTSSNFDGKCFDEPEKIVKIVIGEEDKSIKDDIVLDDNKGDLEKNEDEFNIGFSIPIDNKGNTHIKATGEIKLFDEDGNQIKQIGKKIIINKKGAIIGEKIVDYLPVNDNKGNVLPGTKRIFSPEWQGFPFKEYSQEEGKEVIKYKNPGEYYTDQELKKEFRLLPWERVCYEKNTKKITAKFDISYLDDEGEQISFPSAKEFDITYTRKYIGYNYYLIFLLIGVLFILFLLLWIIGLFRKKKCINKECKKRIKRKEKICPYCNTLQEKNKETKKVIKKKSITKKAPIKKKSDVKKTKKTETKKETKKKVVKKTTVKKKDKKTDKKKK